MSEALSKGEYSGLTSFYGDMMCAVDIETTGLDPVNHCIIQIAVVPLDSNITPNVTMTPFYTEIKPTRIDTVEQLAMDTNGLDLQQLQVSAPSSDAVIGMFDEWFNSLPIPPKKRIIPLAHNMKFEHSFLNAWLGAELYNQYFHFHSRDSQEIACCINDRHTLRGDEKRFKSVGLSAMCREFGIDNPNAHDALADSIACAKVYRELLRMDLT